MKTIIRALCLTLLALLLLALAVFGDTTSPYSITGVTLFDPSYNVVSSIPSGVFFAEVEVTNNAYTGRANVMLVSYDEQGRLLETNYAYVNLAIGQSFTYGASFTNKDGQAASVKGFVFSSLQGMKPLASSDGTNLVCVVLPDGSYALRDSAGAAMEGFSVNQNGELILAFSDGTENNYGKVTGEKGEKGDKGDAGRGIASMALVDGELVVTYTDDTTQNLGRLIADDSQSEALLFERLPNGSYGVKMGAAYEESEITIPSEYNGQPVTTVLEHGFEGCANLTTVNLPDTITVIRDYAFAECASLAGITLPNQIKTLGRHAFESDSALESITIPASMKFLGAFAFYKSGLTSAVFENTNWTRYNPYYYSAKIVKYAYSDQIYSVDISYNTAIPSIDLEAPSTAAQCLTTMKKYFNHYASDWFVTD